MHYTDDGEGKNPVKPNESAEDNLNEKQCKQDIFRLNLKQNTYLISYVQMATIKKNQAESYKSVCLCLLKSKDGFKLHIIDKSKSAIIQSIQKKCLEELSIAQTQIQLVGDKQMLIEETIKKKSKTVKLRFDNKFVRFRWFTMLDNLRYFLVSQNNGHHFQNFNNILNIPEYQKDVKPGKLPFEFEAPYGYCKQQAKNSKYHILPIVFKQSVYYTAFAEFKDIQLNNQRLQCLLILYEHKKVVYFAIAYNNIDYDRLSPSFVKKEEIQQRFRKEEIIHIIEKPLSQVEWSQSKKNQIKFQFGKASYEIYLPELRDHWHIFLLNNKYNKSVEPQIANTFRIFNQFKQQKQSIEALQGLFSASVLEYQPSQKQLLKKQPLKKQPQKKQKRKNKKQSQSHEIERSASNNDSGLRNIQQDSDLKQKVKQQKIIIQNLKSQLKKSTAEKRELAGCLVDFIGQGIEKSMQFDVSKSHLSQPSISIIQKQLNASSLVSQSNKSSYIKILQQMSSKSKIREQINKQSDQFAQNPKRQILQEVVPSSSQKPSPKRQILQEVVPSSSQKPSPHKKQYKELLKDMDKSDLQMQELRKKYEEEYSSQLKPAQNKSNKSNPKKR